MYKSNMVLNREMIPLSHKPTQWLFIFLVRKLNINIKLKSLFQQYEYGRVLHLCNLASSSKVNVVDQLCISNALKLSFEGAESR